MEWVRENWFLLVLTVSLILLAFYARNGIYRAGRETGPEHGETGGPGRHPAGGRHSGGHGCC